MLRTHILVFHVHSIHLEKALFPPSAVAVSMLVDEVIPCNLSTREDQDH